MQSNRLSLPKPRTASTSPDRKNTSGLANRLKVSTGDAAKHHAQVQDFRSTVSHLTKYLQQLLMENCQLKCRLEGRCKEVSCLQQQLVKKQRQNNEIRESKKQFEETVRTISEINATFIKQLDRKNADIENLKRRLLEAPYRQASSQGSEGLGYEDSESRTRGSRYKQLRQDIIDKKGSKISTAASDSLAFRVECDIAELKTTVFRFTTEQESSGSSFKEN